MAVIPGQHGGARAGSGRKVEIEGGVSLTLYLPAALVARLRRRSERAGKSLSATARAILAEVLRGVR